MSTRSIKIATYWNNFVALGTFYVKNVFTNILCKELGTFYVKNVFTNILCKELGTFYVKNAFKECGRKTSPHISTIVQFIFYSWSFEISVNILRNQK